MTEVIDPDIEHKKMKEDIKGIVASYKKTFPDEYDQLVQTLKDKRGQVEVDDNEWAELEDAGDAIERHMFDVPQTLYSAFVRELDENALDWLYARGEFEGDFTGMHWFMDEFSEFTVTKNY